MLNLRISAFLPLWLVACSPGEHPGEAAQALTPALTIGNVRIDPTTIHFNDPSTLLASAEGCGPRTLDISVSNSVAPQVSFTATYTPTDSDVSKALGYSVTQAISLGADSTVLVPINAYARCDAYPTFQRATFQIFSQSWFGPMVVGTGSVLKPVGVYFETCGVLGTDPCGMGCVNGRPIAGGAPGAAAGSGGGANAGGAGGDDGHGARDAG